MGYGEFEHKQNIWLEDLLTSKGMLEFSYSLSELRCSYLFLRTNAQTRVESGEVELCRLSTKKVNKVNVDEH